MSGQIIVLDAVRLRRAADRLVAIASRQAEIGSRLRQLSTLPFPAGPWQGILGDLARIGSGLTSLATELEQLAADLRRRALRVQELGAGSWPAPTPMAGPGFGSAISRPVLPWIRLPDGSVLLGTRVAWTGPPLPPWGPGPSRRLQQLLARLGRLIERHPVEDLEVACLVLGLVPELGLPFNLVAAGIEFSRGDDGAAAVSLAAAAADLVGVAVEVRVLEMGAGVAETANAGTTLRVARLGEWSYADLPPEALGGTLPDGTILIRRGLQGRVLLETLRHELIHSALRQLPPVRFVVVRLYPCSQLWRYLEEAAAEGYATGRPFAAALFPIREGYVTVKGLVGETLATAAAATGLGASAWHAATSGDRS
jgi:hypothetical protein